jgi:two-component system chemotaxis response regulator CheB
LIRKSTWRGSRYGNCVFFCMSTEQVSEPKHIIVIGASAGGLNALTEVVNQFREEWDAAYFIVLHLSRKGISDFLVHRIQQQTTLPCELASEKKPIERGKVYVAVPNFHLLVKKAELRLGHGPEENRWRPSIDVLFRSAAAAYNSHVTGIVLTGLLDDGTSGMWAIKRSGGTTIVQDPNEAEYPDMPLSVLNRMEVDHCVSLPEIGSVLGKLIRDKKFSHKPIPADVIAEAEIAERMASGIDVVEKLGSPSVYTCPDCGGILFFVEDGKIKRYRCHTGHVYNEADLEIKQAEMLESTLWVALRMMEERRNLLTRMEQQTRDRGFERFAKEHRSKADELQEHIDKLKAILMITQRDDET